MEEQKQNNRLNNIIKDLKSGDDAKIEIAIKQLRKHGNSKAIEPILDFYIQSENLEHKNLISNLLFDLKDEEVVGELIKMLSKEKFKNFKPFIISIFWQSSIDASAYISTFVKEAIKGDYLTCIEVLTVLESFDTTFNEEEIEDLKYDIEDVIEEMDTEKQIILNEIKSILESLAIEY